MEIYSNNPHPLMIHFYIPNFKNVTPYTNMKMSVHFESTAPSRLPAVSKTKFKAIDS